MIANKTLMCAIGATAFALAAAATPALAATSNSTQAQSTTKLDGSQYLKDAHISLKQARTIALKAYPGSIAVEELEKEEGGGGLRYSFDIKQAGVTHEVGVDAMNGAVLENSVEGPNAD